MKLLICTGRLLGMFDGVSIIGNSAAGCAARHTGQLDQASSPGRLVTQVECLDKTCLDDRGGSGMR